jgi:hypothetical protein
VAIIDPILEFSPAQLPAPSALRAELPGGIVKIDAYEDSHAQYLKATEQFRSAVAQYDGSIESLDTIQRSLEPVEQHFRRSVESLVDVTVSLVTMDLKHFERFKPLFDAAENARQSSRPLLSEGFFNSLLAQQRRIAAWTEQVTGDGSEIPTRPPSALSTSSSGPQRRSSQDSVSSRSPAWPAQKPQRNVNVAQRPVMSDLSGTRTPTRQHTRGR